MEHWLDFTIWAGVIALLTLVIWRWNRGAQRRRFNRTFPTMPDPFWTTNHALFLAAIERDYALPFGWAKRLPHQSTPMGLYLALYPEHCIYDDCENERFISTLQRHLKRQMPKEPLTQTFEILATAWLSATSCNA